MGDLELVESVRRGDARAWADVYDAYAPRLHALCARLLGEPHLADDAVQDTFVLAARRIDQLRDPAKLRAWLYAIARNECTRQGRARARLVPVEETEVVSTPAAEDPGHRAAAGEVAELLWAAADGLDDRDRLLLELNVRHGLEGQELAEAAGVRPGQISMATARMRERVERSLGALLVARRGSDDCPGLGAVLQGWDGTFSVLLRKRVARHVERCERCDERRRSLVAPLGSMAALPFVLPPTALRDQVLAAVSSVTAGDGGDPWPDGFPPVPVDPTARRRALVALVAAAVVLLLVGGGLALALADDDGDEVDLASGPGSSTSQPLGSGAGQGTPQGSAVEAPPSTAVPGTTPVVPAPSAPVTTVPDPAADPDVVLPGPADPATPPDGPAPPPVADPPSGATTTTAPPPVGEGPVIGVPVVTGGNGGALEPPCVPTNSVRYLAVDVTDPDGVASVVLRWNAPDGTAGEQPMSFVRGRWRATLGPFATPGTAGYSIHATDVPGAASTSPTRTLTVEPCPVEPG